MRGRFTKNTSGMAAKKNRKPQSAKGGISRSPTLIGTKEKPSMVTTNKVSARSRGASRVFRAASCSGSGLQLDDASRLQRFAQRDRDARGFGRVVQCQRWGSIVEHAVDEVHGLAQKGILETLVEGRRALVAHAVRVGDVEAVQTRVLADREPACGAEDLGRSLVAMRHGARSVEAGHLAVGEFAGRDTVVDVSEFAQALVDRDHAG